MPNRVGVLGTLVWDTIHPFGGGEPVVQWGGIAYSLSAWSAACLCGWEIVPIIKVGADLEWEARRFLSGLESPLDLNGLQAIDAPNCRVELHYRDEGERDETLTGGTIPWTIDELRPVLRDLDALYVNHMTGFEIDIECAAAIRSEFKGPIYSDLHSLFLGEPGEGPRLPRRLENARRWLASSDVIQVNETELELLTASDGFSGLIDMVVPAPLAILVTLGSDGARYAAPEILPGPATWSALRSGLLPSPSRKIVDVHMRADCLPGDPTGCGDIWGSVVFADLLRGKSLPEAMKRGNTAASARLAARSIGELPSRIHEALAG